LRQLTHQIQDERKLQEEQRKKKAAATKKVCFQILSHFPIVLTKCLYSKVIKSKPTIESDDDIEIITGNDGNSSNEVDASDKVCPETVSNGLMKILTKALGQMLVDDEDKPVHDIGVVPKGLRFKKLKVDHDCAHEDHPEASCPSAPVRLHFSSPIIPFRL
jgi:hypothetical protein